jgi:hypothetical protein
MTRMQLRIAPLHNDPVDLGVENGARIWGAATIDPAFLARLPEGSAPLAPGWYRVSAVIDGRSGDVREPRLYLPDPAGQYSEKLTVDMARDGRAFVAEFLLPHPVDHVRFDPSNTRCEFALDALEITPIGAPAPKAAASAPPPEGRASLLDRARRAFRKAAAATVHDAATLSRKARVLSTIDRDGFGVEIGPSHDPIAPKRDGFKVHVIDHATRAELLEKYRDHPVQLDRIEEVDFVWRGQSYVELTGRPRFYAWIIASNLVEHTPDLIAFLDDCDSILRDGGVLSLVVPDKRYCFDRFRPITGLARIIDAHLAGNRIHTPGVVAEHYMNVAGKAHRLSWDAHTRGEYGFIHSAHEAREKIREVSEGAYVDLHNWCFVPHSFRLLMADLYALGYTKLREVDFQSTAGGFEFYATLGRHGTGPHLSRLELMRKIDAELTAPDTP